MFGGGDFKPRTAFFHVTVLGAQERGDKLTIDFNVPCDLEKVRADKPAQAAFISASINAFQKEVKHSATWGCFNCGEPAREVVHNPMSWLHATPAFVMDYAHMICRTSGGPCRKVIEESNAELAQEMGMEWQNQLKPASDTDEPSTQPLAAACANCYKEGKVAVCSRCKAIRYCGPECQKEDYGRHKSVCRWVDHVEKDFPADKTAEEKEKEKLPGGENWPAGIPRP